MITCPYCKEDTGTIDDGFHCSSCGKNETGPIAARDFVEDVMNLDEYKVVSDGGDWPLTFCNDCGQESFVDFGPPEDIGVGLRALCFSCGYEIANREPDLDGGPRNCLKCGKLFSAEDGITVCPDCLDDSMSED